MTTAFHLSGKVVLVTGGTRGLGRALTIALAEAGAHVFAGYFQNDEAAVHLVAECEARRLRCEAVKANLMTTAGIQSLSETVVGRAGRVDALVYNAATGVHKTLEGLTQRHLAIVWQVNVGAFFDLSLKLRPHMPPGSRIVAISSEGAARAIDAYGAVGSSKAALEAVCRQMAVEWIGDGINVNVVAPGLLETDTLKAITDAERRVAAEIATTPLGRLVRLEEVAQVVQFLCCPAAQAIVGQTIVVDGGKRISAVVR